MLSFGIMIVSNRFDDLDIQRDNLAIQNDLDSSRAVTGFSKKKRVTRREIRVDQKIKKFG